MKQIGNSGLSPALTTIHKEAVEAYLCANIVDLKKVDMITPLKNAVQSAYVIIGQGKSLAPGDIAIMVDELIKELKKTTWTFTVQEVCLAIDDGIKGKLNNLTDIPQPIISVTNIIQWVWKWNELVRVPAIDAQKRWEANNESAEKLAQEKKRREEGNARLDSEILDCLISYRSNPEIINGVDEALRACYFRRMRERQEEKILDTETMNQILAVADSQIKDFDELGKEQQHALRHRVDREKWDRDRMLEVKIRAQSIALKYVFDKQK